MLSLKREQPGLTLKSSEGATAFIFEEHYKLQNKLSKGSFGIVYLSEHKATSEEYAVKVIERSELNEKEKSSVEREVSILKDFKDVHHIVQLVDFFASPERYYVVQQFAQGGDVFERLAQRTSYTEKDARDLAVHLLEAVEVLHSRKLAHRDLKPENLLLRDMLDDTAILVADFGFAAYVPEEGLKTRCGTPAFVAPQILTPNCRYDERVDMWSVGCLLYMLIAGYPPFQDRNHRGLFRKVRGADYVFHDVYWKNVSISAKQLISSLLTVDPRYRCTARMALEKSNWLKMDASLLKAHDLAASLGEIKRFHARRTLKSAIHAVVWSVKYKSKSESDALTAAVNTNKAYKGWDMMMDAARADGQHVMNLKTLDMNDEPSGFHHTEVADSNDNKKGPSYGHAEFYERLDRSDSILMTKLRPTLTFHDVYQLKELLHSGQTVVYECYHKKTKSIYAVKIIERNDDKQQKKKTVLGRTLTETIFHEVSVLDSLEHENIIQIQDFFEDDDKFYLVMERMYGGDVFERIMKHTKYTEWDAKRLAKVLLQTVAYFHEQGIAHRDLKPQNLLLKSVDDVASIKVADFGFACRVHTPQSLTTRCGTPSYVAPEVLKNIPYDQSADMWSVGIILYVLLCGCPPFVDENQSELFRKIRTADWKFRGEEWSAISNEAKDLIKRLLVANPLQRLTAKQALKSRWFRTEDLDANITNTQIPNPPVLKERKLDSIAIVSQEMELIDREEDVDALKVVEQVLNRPEAAELKRRQNIIPEYPVRRLVDRPKKLIHNAKEHPVKILKPASVPSTLDEMKAHNSEGRQQRKTRIDGVFVPGKGETTELTYSLQTESNHSETVIASGNVQNEGFSAADGIQKSTHISRDNMSSIRKPGEQNREHMAPPSTSSDAKRVQQEENAVTGSLAQEKVDHHHENLIISQERNISTVASAPKQNTLHNRQHKKIESEGNRLYAAGKEVDSSSMPGETPNDFPQTNLTSNTTLRSQKLSTEKRSSLGLIASRIFPCGKRSSSIPINSGDKTLDVARGGLNSKEALSSSIGNTDKTHRTLFAQQEKTEHFKPNMAVLENDTLKKIEKAPSPKTFVSKSPSAENAFPLEGETEQSESYTGTSDILDPFKVSEYKNNQSRMSTQTLKQPSKSKEADQPMLLRHKQGKSPLSFTHVLVRSELQPQDADQGQEKSCNKAEHKGADEFGLIEI